MIPLLFYFIRTMMSLAIKRSIDYHWSSFQYLSYPSRQKCLNGYYRSCKEDPWLSINNIRLNIKLIASFSSLKPWLVTMYTKGLFIFISFIQRTNFKLYFKKLSRLNINKLITIGWEWDLAICEQTGAIQEICENLQ